MRILQVLHDFIDTNLGGTELYTYYLSRELQKNHEVGVFYYTHDGRSDVALKQSSYEGIRTFTVNIPTWNIMNYRNDRIDGYFRRVLSLFDPDLIHFQHLLYSSMNFPAIAKSLRYTTVHTLHDFYLICPRIRLIDNTLNRCEEIRRLKCFVCCLNPYSKKNLIRRLVMEHDSKRLFFHLFWERRRMVSQRVFKDIGLFISPSQFLRDKFIEHGLSHEKIIYSDNGMNFEITNGDMLRKHSNNCRIFGYIGSHQVEKGVPLLIRAFNEIENAKLYIYGSGKEKEYQTLAKNQNIHFKGKINDGQKREAFSQIDVLIVPSIWYENSPLTIHEAFMFKTPVITSDIGGMAELVEDRVSGLHFKAGDVQDLREKIKLCINHPELVRMMGEKVPKVKSIKENAEELEKIYFHLLDKSKPQSQQGS